jgi:hypothetical protein
MSNPIKYSTGSETLALKKGNFYIGTGDVGKGPTSSTGYYNGITPPSGGYTIYLNKETGGPSIYTVSNDTQLISLTNSIAGQSYTTANECLVYFAGQTDKMVLNRNYEGIVTDGLVFNVDAGFTPSYPKNGTTWYDVGGSNNGTLTNGPTFNSGDGGSIVFDGADDYVTFPSSSDFNFSSNDFSFECFTFFDSSTSSDNTYRNIFTIGNNFNTISSWMTLTKWRSGLGNGVVLDYAYNGGRYVITTSTTIPSPNVRYTVSSPLYSVNNKWTHFIATMNSNTLTLYINGTSVGDVTVDNKWDITMDAKIGVDGYSSYMKGKIPIVRLYKNKSLSADEVLQNYNATKGRFGL